MANNTALAGTDETLIKNPASCLKSNLFKKPVLRLLLYSLLVAGFILIIGSVRATNIVSTPSGGNWSSTSTWSSGTRIPIATDTVTIANGATVVLDQDVTITSLIVGQGVSGIIETNDTTYFIYISGAGTPFQVNSGGSVIMGNNHIKIGFTNTGAVYFKAPISISATVECWGAGGGGGSVVASTPPLNIAAGGGGGGAYATKSSVSLIHDTTYAISVGVGGTCAAGSPGVTGGSSRFKGSSDSVVAVGGSGAYAATGTSIPGLSASGGAKTSCTPSSTAFSGGNGAVGASNASGGGGGGAGSSGNGVSAGTPNPYTAGTGTVINGGNGGVGLNNVPGNGINASTIGFGGGGGGAFTNNSTSDSGGVGAQGLVAISWVTCIPPNLSRSSAAGTDAQSLCVNTTITPVTYSVGGGATGATVSGLPNGVGGIYNSGTFTISGTPTVTGTYTYSLNTTGGLCGVSGVTGSIATSTTGISKTSGAGSDAQTVCINTPIASITYNVGGNATGANVSGLPGGVGGTYNNSGTFTISGTPTASGTFSYSVSTVGGDGICGPTGATGSLTVNAQSVTLTSGAGTTDQSACMNSLITPIIYSIGNGATGASVTGLPSGVGGSFNAGTYTISGAPGVTGSFSYSVTPIGGSCGSGTAGVTGTIAVSSPTISLTSAAGTDSQTECINTAITTITYGVGGSATGASVSGLPPGLTGAFNSGPQTFTINGSPSQSGAFTFTVTTGGGACGTASANVTLTVKPASASTASATACDSYAWNGSTYTVSGSYTYHTFNAAGCDSAVSLALTINHGSTSVKNVNACDSYAWNGSIYTASGNYTYHTTNATGCDSAATLALTISGGSKSFATESACNSYAWNGSTYTVSGSYTYHTSNAAGCDSAAILTLTIGSNSTSVTAATACDTYIWNGSTYITGGDKTTLFTGGNAAGCDSTATLHLVINNSSSSTQSVTACDSYAWNGSTYTGSGSYSFNEGSNSAGCDSMATLNLTVSGPCSTSSYTVYLFLQGYYIGGGRMSPLLHLLGASSAIAVDTVTIELHEAGSPGNSPYAFTGVLNSDGSIACAFPAGAIGGSYYLVIKHRNSLETWSATVQTISNGGSYDFTTGADKAYGGVAGLGNGVFGIYSGDINRDGAIDNTDKSLLQNALSSFRIGVYNANDITGDGFVDEDDYRLLNNNIGLSLSVSHP